ncbi:hypothetical protein ADL12_01420 [Streptomyces regalis]|uniref:Uncharacterized protein n=1 Tax=Streptomyces regalis TaxID=68262 RepID=A0A0X3VRC8_9ACTN|nr:hypothetical protein ADL12_01420 [Streptomyces regalis]
MWALFGNYCTAAAELRTDIDYADTIASLRRKLYLPQVSPSTGRLEEWMSPDNLGEITHRHLSPLVGLFPGDRIRPDGSTPADIVAGATALLIAALLIARATESFGWANAWRSQCWARLKETQKACQLVVSKLRPSTGGSHGTAPNLPYSRPGHIELLPALRDPWAGSGFVRGVAARGGFEVDLRRRDGRPTEARIHSVGGRTTTVAYGGVSRTVTMRRGASFTLKDFAR